MPLPQSSTEHVLDIAYLERWGLQQPRSGGIMQNGDHGCACFQEKVSVARAAVNNVYVRIPTLATCSLASAVVSTYFHLYRP